MAVEAFERAVVARDLVRERSAVVARPPRERDALVQAEQRLSRRRLVFQHDLDVGDPAAKLRRERIESVLDQLFEVWSGVVGGLVRFGLPLAEEPLDAQDLQQPLEQHHLPREVFFFGLAFAGMTLPATAARAFCFLVAISASWGSLGQPTDATPAAGVRKMRRLVAPLTAAACCPHSRSLPNEGVATREPRVKRRSTIRRSASVSSRAPIRSGQSNETCASVSRLSVLASRLELWQAMPSCSLITHAREEGHTSAASKRFWSQWSA